MITPKSEETLIEELRMFSDDHDIQDGKVRYECSAHSEGLPCCLDLQHKYFIGIESLFRSALRSYAAWVMEQGKPKVFTVCSKHQDPEEDCRLCTGLIVSYRQHIDDYAFRMREIIEKV